MSRQTRPTRRVPTDQTDPACDPTDQIRRVPTDQTRRVPRDQTWRVPTVLVPAHPDRPDSARHDRSDTVRPESRQIRVNRPGVSRLIGPGVSRVPTDRTQRVPTDTDTARPSQRRRRADRPAPVPHRPPAVRHRRLDGHAAAAAAAAALPADATQSGAPTAAGPSERRLQSIGTPAAGQRSHASRPCPSPPGCQPPAQRCPSPLVAVRLHAALSVSARCCLSQLDQAGSLGAVLFGVEPRSMRRRV